MIAQQCEVMMMRVSSVCTASAVRYDRPGNEQLFTEPANFTFGGDLKAGENLDIPTTWHLTRRR